MRTFQIHPMALIPPRSFENSNANDWSPHTIPNVWEEAVRTQLRLQNVCHVLPSSFGGVPLLWVLTAGSSWVIPILDENNPFELQGDFCSCYCRSYVMFSLNSPIITESSPNNLKLTLNSNWIYKATFGWCPICDQGAQFSVPGCHFDEGSSPQFLQVLPQKSFALHESLGKHGVKKASSSHKPLRSWCSKKPPRNGTYDKSSRLQGACWKHIHRFWL